MRYFASNIKNEMLCQIRERNCYLQEYRMEMQPSHLVGSKQVSHITCWRLFLVTAVDADNF